MSIRLRLTLYWAAVLTALVVLAGVAVFILFERAQWTQLDSALVEESDSVGAAIRRMGAAAAPDLVRRLSEERDLGPRRRAVLLINRRVAASYGAAAADLPAPLVPRAPQKIVSGEYHIFRYGVARFQLGGESAVVLDGVDASPIRAAIARLKRLLLTLLPIVLAASIAGGYWLAGRALAPIDRLIAGLARIEPRAPEQRLPRPMADDEVAQLTGAINQLLERVAHAAETERRFAADAAHEMRTPLAVLRTGLEVALGRDRQSWEYRRALAAALDETVRLCGAAEELLTLSRLNHEISVARGRLRLAPLISEAAEALAPLAEAKQLEVCANLAGDVAVEGNAEHLKRLVINLLDNAIKFTPEHGRIELSLVRRDAAAEFRVADNGPSIPSDELPHVFERFFRSKTAVAEGSGLGLSLCSEIVRLHQGTIGATNLAEGGVQFVVTLPLVNNDRARSNDAA